MILMDIQMPEMDGLEAMKEIRQLPGREKIPIIAVSAHAFEEEQRRFVEEGMSGCLSKPFRPADLFALVESWERSTPDGSEPGTPVPVLASSLSEQGAAEIPATELPPSEWPTSELPAFRRPTAGLPAVRKTTAVKPTEPGVLQLDELREMMREAGIEDTFDRLIDLFLEVAPQRMRALEEATAELLAKDMRSTAHAFKSSAQGIYAPALAAALQQVESAAAKGRVKDAALLVPLVRERHVAVADLLNSVIERRGSQAAMPLASSSG